MPLDGTVDDVELDFDILEIIGTHHDGLTGAYVEAGTPMKTIRRWLLGHADLPEDFDRMACLVAMALDLELFTPSPSGKTAIDRYLLAKRPNGVGEAKAFDALRAAQFRLVAIVGRDSPDLVRLRDLVTREELTLLDSRLSPLAVGSRSAMRLCPLPSGRHVVISPLFALDEATLASAMTFVRPGRALGHRCAANLYRDAARRGVLPLPSQGFEIDAINLIEAVERLSVVERLALRWLATNGAETDRDLIDDIRRAACADNVVDACGCYGRTGVDAPVGLKAAFEKVAEILMETIVQRDRAGMAGYVDTLKDAGADISRHVAKGDMSIESRKLFERLNARRFRSAGGIDPADGVKLDRIVQLIHALRAKTVAQGCTEEEAMTAAAKVAQLLARHDLTLDELSVREAECEGSGIDTGRRRRAPIDGCNQTIADFCDCRLWMEQTESGDLRYIFFGLKADVEAARLLHDLIAAAFETETAAFRGAELHRALRGGDRRAAVNSFQIGLANGISAKLRRLETARRTAAPKTMGFDLVIAKQSVVDEEMAKLGLAFTARSGRSRRRVHDDAYAAGKAAGQRFEPEAALAR